MVQRMTLKAFKKEYKFSTYYHEIKGHIKNGQKDE